MSMWIAVAVSSWVGMSLPVGVLIGRMIQLREEAQA